jgi:hypothetical protein
MTCPPITMAARVPSRDSCSSVIGPGNFNATGPASTGIRAGWPDGSWITRTTFAPSTTTHTASSRDQLGRDKLLPSNAWAARPPSGPIHSVDCMSGAPGRSTTTEAAS